MLKSSLTVITLSSLLIAGCTREAPGTFGLESSPIRYRTATFDDPKIMAEANGQTYTYAQVLDQSPVMKDLRQQESEMQIGLAYLRMLEKFETAGKKPGPVEIYGPEPKSAFAQILNRFGAKVSPNAPVTFKHAAGDVVARSGGVEVKREELDLNHVAYQSLEQRMFEEAAVELNSQISRILLAERSFATKRELSEYLRTEVYGGEVTVSKADLTEYLKEISVPEEGISDEARESFTSAVKTRKEQRLTEEYVAKNVLKGPMKVSFSEPGTRMRLNAGMRPVAGFQTAPISIIAFSAVSCPDCQPFVDSVARAMSSYAGHVKLNWIHTFSPHDGIGEMMATASLCMDTVKTGAMLDFMKTFARTGPQSDERQFADWGSHHGVDPEKFKACMAADQTKDLLRQHVEYAQRVGVVANPTLWIEGRTLAGVIPDHKIDELVDEAIRTKPSSRVMALGRRVKGWFL